MIMPQIPPADFDEPTPRGMYPPSQWPTFSEHAGKLDELLFHTQALTQHHTQQQQQHMQHMQQLQSIQSNPLHFRSPMINYRGPIFQMAQGPGHAPEVGRMQKSFNSLSAMNPYATLDVV
jgi:hypothetical protein